MLIDCRVLEQHLTDPNWIVFDCRHDLMVPERGARLYAEGHIPGAFFASVDTVLSGKLSGTNGRHPLPPPEDFAKFLSQHGVTPATEIVAYDDVGGQYSARLWWMARWIGLTRVSVLDGGMPKWVAEGHPVTANLPPPRTKGSVVARADGSQVVDAADVLSSIKNGSALVLDARAPERFRGEIEPIDPIAGHIPTARNRFFKANLNPDQTLRPASELRSEFEILLAGRAPREVIHHCGSGITACANLLAMEHAGLTGSRLYAGSWSEWIAERSRPIERA